MPRNQVVMKKRAGVGPGGQRYGSYSSNKKGAGRSSSSSSSSMLKPTKIIIKPFIKPPTLPTNFYETTSKELLQGARKPTIFQYSDFVSIILVFAIIMLPEHDQ